MSFMYCDLDHNTAINNLIMRDYDILLVNILILMVIYMLSYSLIVKNRLDIACLCNGPSSGRVDGRS